MEDATAATEAAILERRLEIRASLRSVEASLRDVGAVTDGYASAYFLETQSAPQAASTNGLFTRKSEKVSDAELARSAALRFNFDTPDAFRYSWKLSPLGETKCRKVWAMFDEDEDDVWTYDEFREYLSAIGGARQSVELKAFEENEEVWRMYMSDVCELDEMRLTFDGFVLHRELIEDERPLAADLKRLGISVGSEELEKLETAKRLFQEYIDDPAGGVTARSAQYLLSELGVNLTYKETVDIIERRYQHARCLKAILQLKRSLRLFGYQQKSALRFATEARGRQTEEQPRICEAGLSSLFFSGWMPAVKTRWRDFFLSCRLRSFYTLRRLQHRARWVFRYVRQAASTGLLSASCLQSPIPGRDRGDYMLKLDVGPKFSTSATAHITYNSDADSAATLHELKYLERGAECFVYIDVTCRSGTKGGYLFVV